MKFNRQWQGRQGTPRKFTQKGETVPDQALSISKILRRHAQGIPTLGGREMIFEAVENAGFDDDKMPDLSKMDFAEKEDFLRGINQELIDIKKRVNKERKERTAKMNKEELEKGVQAALNKLKAEQSAAQGKA